MLRRLVYGGAALVLLLAIAIAGGLWWLGTDSGLQFVVSRLQSTMSADGNVLRLDGASGSLRRGIRIERFEWRGEGLQASGGGLVARWSLPALLQRRLLLTELAADTIELRLAPAEPKPPEPVTMPGVIGLPLEIEIQRLAVGELRILPAASPGGTAPEAVVVSDIDARLTYQAGLFAVEQLRAVTPHGRLADARLQIGDSPPHRITADLPLQGEIRQLAFDLRLAASGDLERLQARLSGKAAEADVRLDAILAPMAVMPLVSAQVNLAALDLQRLLPSAPRTLMEADLTLAPQAGGGGWRGVLQARNGASGRLSDGRLPVSSVQASIALLNVDDPASRQLQLRDLQIGLPGAQAGADEGSISGSVDVFPGRTSVLAGTTMPETQASLAFRAIDISQFGPQVAPTALDGTFSLQRNVFALNLSQSRARMLALMPAGSAGAAGDAEVVLAGRLEDAVLRLDEGRIRLGDSRLEARGTAGLAPPHEIAMKGSARQIRPGQWLPPDAPVGDRWRQGVIGGSWSFDGKLAPGLDAALSLNLADSTLAGQPLAADVRGRVVLAADWSPILIEKTMVDVRFAGNRLRASGALGKAADKLALNAVVAEPGLFDERLQGRLSLDGELTGAFNRLQAKLALNGERLSLALPDGAVRVGSVQIQASGPASTSVAPQAALDVSIRLRDVQAGGRRLDAADLKLGGTLAAHRFVLSLSGEGQSARLNGDGQADLQGEPSWRGRLAATTVDGRVPIRLTAPATLRLDGTGFQLDRFNMAVAGGEADLERLSLRWGDKHAFESRGVVRDLPITRLLALAQNKTDENAGTGAGMEALAGLRLDGSWNLRGSGAEDLSGEARLGLREEDAARKRGGNDAARSARGLGIEGDNGVRVVLKNGRLDGRFDLRLPSLAFSHPLTAPDLAVDGSLRLAGSVAGTLAKPQWDANLTGEALSVLQRSVGWRLTGGVLAAHFEGRRFQLQTLKFQSGDGSVELRGQAALLDAPRPGGGAAGAKRPDVPSTLPFDGRFELTAAAFPVPIGPGQRVALSGTTVLASGADGLSLRGKLRADQGIIEIQGSSAPALPADVKLVYPDADTRGALEPVKDQPPGERRKSGIRILTDLAVDLGERLRVTGNGIAARLTGNLQVRGILPDNPQLTGVVNIVEGSYQSYGQNLRIEKGIIRFNGPLDNPALDLVAKRPFLPVEVGVAVTGTALNPKISLVSKPDMPETDKLAWLVLGTDPKNAPSAAQSLALREAAKSLLVNEDGRDKPGIAERLGLDVVNFGYGSDTGPAQGVTERRNPTGLPGGQSVSASAAQQEVVTLGKRLGSRLFVSYEQGVRGLYNLLRIQYALSQRLSLRAQSGSDNAVDLLYSYSFD